MATADEIATEEEARAMAIYEARQYHPSQVVRISNSGDTKVIAEFE